MEKKQFLYLLRVDATVATFNAALWSLFFYWIGMRGGWLVFGQATMFFGTIIILLFEQGAHSAEHD